MISNRLYLNDVLFTLYATETLGWSSLNRTNFQRILYFCAVLSPLTSIEWRYTFTNGVYGPFNNNVLKATDDLVFYGYTEIVNIMLQKDNKLRAQYRITEKGKREVEKISRLVYEEKRLEWITSIAKVLDIYGLKIVSKLAYEEPTFMRVRESNQNYIDISSEENLSIQLLSKIENELTQKFSVQLDTVVSQLIVYFDFLSSNNVGVG